ncbi:T/G mismatch-specific endonuclease [Panacagrimonas perspica]|uniref:T/G mismatch-specific endonuclease n=1 Tax=Panacagrimonas perspica TaxID=381431 RepID=A0A4R7P5W4_9GAMM|nr:very short patch repair endonuclease [Panacagrimonas perspica]TDU28862.1 T/G mismatch-specific endonuclease [Panacagrimonas perspica]THD02309.1 hypothetical protein B1810_15395 [Panacagrimonas perspica]
MADRLTPERRSRLMSRVRSADTDIETSLRSELHRRGLRFRKHVKSLPGRPDIVFGPARVAVFVDGDFWHGWRFREKAQKLPPYWREKIRANRVRDLRNFRLLRRQGWKVVRIWGHSIKADPSAAADRVQRTIAWRLRDRRRFAVARSPLGRG